MTSVVPLTPLSDGSTKLVARISGWHQPPLPTGSSSRPAIWELDPLTCGHRPAHANDGPASAYVVQADGPIACREPRCDRGASRPRIGAEALPALSLVERDGVAAAAWAAAATCEQRAHPRDAVLSSEGDAVSAVVAEGLAPEHYEVTDEGEQFLVRGITHGVAVGVAAMAWHRRGDLDVIDGRHEPCRGWRGLHVDVARQFVPAPDVEWLIEVAAWHRLNRLHVHLTDDEGWRLQVPGHPALTDVAAWRGDGCAVPPLLGTGADPTGGWYSSETIATWVDRAADLGIEVVPEVDLATRRRTGGAPRAAGDPEDVSGAVSVRHFVGNVLNPGVEATWPFLEAVFGELADRFRRRGCTSAATRCRMGHGGVHPLRSGGLPSEGSPVPMRSERRSSVRSSTSCGPRLGGRSACGRRPRAARSGCRVRRRLEVSRRRLPAGVGRAPGRRRAAPWYYLDHAADDDWWSPERAGPVGRP